MTGNAVEVERMWKKFRLYHEKNQYLKTAVMRGGRSRYEDFWALQDVTFQVHEGEAFGIIGSNGSGKSTMLKCLAGILAPDRGKMNVHGRMAALLELGAGFHPDLSGRENVHLNGAILGMTKAEISRKFDEVVSFAGLEKFIDTPVKNYSSGMVVRLGFAIAINVNPEILVIDEVLAVGDEEFQQRCFQKIEQFRREGRTIIFVSHGLGQVSQLCDRALWLDHGSVRAIGPAYEVVSDYTGVAHHVEQFESPDSIDQSLNRWGTGEVEITAVRLTDKNGNQRATFTSGTPFNIEIDYRVVERVKELVVGIRITHLHGLNIFGTNTKRSAVEIDCAIDMGTVIFSVESLPILEGVFDVTVGLSDNAEIDPYDHLEKGFRFNVVQSGTFNEGATRFEGRWSRGK